MTKADIVKQIARETGVEAVTVSAVVEEFMEQVRAAQIRKENVYLRGFGTFLIKSRKEKKGRDIMKNTDCNSCTRHSCIQAFSRLPAAFGKEMIAR